MMSRHILSRFVGLLLIGSVLVGCGSGRRSGRPDIDAIPEIEHRGGATKNAIYAFRARVKKNGVNAAKQDLPDLLENIEAHQKLKLGEHVATYKELGDKLKALQGELSGSPSKDAVLKSIDDICAVAEKLPGQANKEPTVE